ncbi:hypothetical protein I6I18_06390 [Kytococcus sedentarius]|uniref:Uncharacterized protein n=1 Tax=Kytococcus sedentarius (strain ATCC 14392 / DSM 20547 / JCM 11482 / CCUG 33030 / NBRC 15357 / NCTC 11040 / CCM 314 / 541) TaxID=478801 RepID=C7NJ55_KYTSD|nr:hypothetical protein [Kytococcus sedentarius]ACV06742.1 hypothetical protein Ksed_17290 [Kytococcus sedentarius DSM 20547]QQB65017.1 hypothetical protein I6I18_06390 [Kytococcus sedentarius]STX14443.1 Uncharacterised protein [Kytococcus sedentarius]
MPTRRGPKKYRRRITGASASATGGGLSSSLVRTDGAELQSLVDFIDARRAFFEDIALEVGDQVTKSVSEAREFARSTLSLVESEEAAEIAQEIQQACIEFLRAYNPPATPTNYPDPQLLANQLRALRTEVNRYVALALHLFGVSTPRNLDLSDVDVTARVMSDVWRNKP